jgi:UTP:GlnB (protein PII) uridylyltransferase
MSERDAPSDAALDTSSSSRPPMTRQADDALASYIASMPLGYRSSFDREAMAAHAAIVARRGDRAAHVAIWGDDIDGAISLCVVADDRPGLLSQISAALVAHGIDVVHAHGYCRKSPHGDEAVDFLTVRRQAPSEQPLGEREVERIRETLEALMLGRASFDGVVRFAVAVRSSSASTRVRFEKDETSGAMVLTVEAVDRPGLLLVLTQTLFRASVQIIGVRASTEDGRAIDQFHLVELDGAPLRRERLLELQTAVLTAIEESWQRT